MHLPVPKPWRRTTTFLEEELVIEMTTTYGAP
jgi:hypothetical protein